MTRGGWRIAAVVACVVLGVGMAGSAGAMTSNSQPDGYDHPYVVALLRSTEDGWRPFCSGTLLTETVVVTASHCTDAMETRKAGADYAVTNDPTLPVPDFQLSELEAGSYVMVAEDEIRTNPAYKQGVREDVSLLVLAEPLEISGEFPVLPEAGLLDQLSQKELRTTPMYVLGYGFEEAVTGAGGLVKPRSNERRIAEMYAIALNPQHIHQLQRTALGEDGACNGDSGGPTFLGDGSTEAPVIVAVTSTGDLPCWATNVASRSDRQSLLDFIESVLAETAG